MVTKLKGIEMKRFIVPLIVIVVMFGIVGCEEDSPTADQLQAERTQRSMREANAQVGMPAIKNFQEKKLAKMIYELRDQEKLICYAYLKSLDGKPVFLGKCVGFGLPYCVQFSNPERIIKRGEVTRHRMLTAKEKNDYAGGSPSKIQQPEPNGLFMPQSLSATWLMMIDPKTGDARPVYIEPEIIVSPFPLI